MGFIENLEKELFEMQDLKYRDFHSKLLSGIDKETIIGIRTPVLRKFTKEYAKTPGAELFMQELPHRYYEENNMHMMIAWYLATALAKQWDAAIPYLEERKLPEWVHRKTIQKAIESYRITPEQKVYLKTLRK